MKKAILIIICSILILPNLKTETTWAVDISLCSTPDELTPTHQSGDFKYFESDGAIAITAYTGTGGDVVIPSAIDGKPVVSIWYMAFSNISSLTSVTIPNSVTCIGDAAFFGCDGLISIVVDASNTAYSSQNGVLYNKAKTVLIQYPGSKAGGFTIPNSVTSIGDWAFSNCHYLTSVVIPNSVTSIGKYAFSNCHDLTSVTIPDSVTSIGDAAFYDCHRLTSIFVDASNTVYSSQDGVLYNKAKTVLIQYPGGKSGGFTIPETVTSIGDAAFSNCHDLTRVTIGNSVTSIGVGAFSSCNSLTSVVIPNSVTSIGEDAFRNCTALTRAYFYGNAPSMGEYVFKNCSSHFTVCYTSEATGFTTPTWYGYPARACAETICVAETIYGRDSEETELLREYRDKVLSKSSKGRQMIKTYYELSPAVVEVLQKNDTARASARKALDTFLPAIREKVKQ